MENLLERESIKRVIKKLEEFDASLKVEILNNSARTAKDAALSLNCQVGAIVKSLLLRVNDNFILCLVSGDKRCSLNKIKKIINMKDVSMADAEQVKNQTGFSIGGVSPIGHMKKINILIEKIIYRKLLKKDGILIIHRHKKDKIVITEKINILDTRTYGVSKVYFAN